MSRSLLCSLCLPPFRGDIGEYFPFFLFRSYPADSPSRCVVSRVRLDNYANQNGVCSDDLTVQVIFFGSGAKTGEVVVNQEATANYTPKAKL